MLVLLVQRMVDVIHAGADNEWLFVAAKAGRQ